LQRDNVANPLEYKQAIAGTIAGVVLAVIGMVSPFGNNIIRPNPFTSLDGDRLEDKIDELDHRLDRVDAIQQTMSFRMKQREASDRECTKTLRDHLMRHP